MNIDVMIETLQNLKKQGLTDVVVVQDEDGLRYCEDFIINVDKITKGDSKVIPEFNNEVNEESLKIAYERFGSREHKNFDSYLQDAKIKRSQHKEWYGSGVDKVVIEFES